MGKELGTPDGKHGREQACSELGESSKSSCVSATQPAAESAYKTKASDGVCLARAINSYHFTGSLIAQMVSSGLGEDEELTGHVGW